jgi:stage II sporulation protein D
LERNKGFSAAALALLLATRLWAADSSTDVRIGILTQVPSAMCGAGRHRVRDLTTGRYEDISLSGKTKIAPGPRGIGIAGKYFGKRIRLEALADGEIVQLNGRPYRGFVEFFWRSPSQLTAVNILPVDDYVKGILTHEVNPSWPPEALKAQAVISRTYALRNKNRHGRDGYDLCPEPHCQVYRGRAAERDTTNRAVESTAEQVVYHDGQMLSTVFHSNCGGSTENAENVWDGTGHPALKAVKCRWCRGNPKYFWKAEYGVDDIARRLDAAGAGVGRPRSLKVLSRTRSGRVDQIQITGTRGSVVLRGNKFRTIMNGRVLRSTLWTGVSTGRRAWRFTGKGWGHGVGLCQFGAKGMAEKGWDYRRILRHYYRHSSVRKNK